MVAKDGSDGSVRISIDLLHNLELNKELAISVGAGGKGGKGGAPGNESADAAQSPTDYFGGRGGRGGGYEFIPLRKAIESYRHSCDPREVPLCFTAPGEYKVVWPYETPSATMITISGGGGGGGGQGARALIEGDQGGDGLSGAVYIFPTYLSGL